MQTPARMLHSVHGPLTRVSATTTTTTPPSLQALPASAGGHLRGKTMDDDRDHPQPEQHQQQQQQQQAAAAQHHQHHQQQQESAGGPALFFCHVCQSEYRDAKLLHCLHTFCRPCLEHAVVMVAPQDSGNHQHHRQQEQQQQASVVVCPTCALATPLPPQGLQGLTGNTFLQRVSSQYVSGVRSTIVAKSLSPKVARRQHGQQAVPGPPGPYESYLATSGVGGAPRRRFSEEMAHLKLSNLTDEQKTVTTQHLLCHGDSEIAEASAGLMPEFRRGSVDRGDYYNNVSALEAVNNMSRLQGKLMSLQGEALRVTYAIDRINDHMTNWHQHKEDLKLEVSRRSHQFQVAAKRMERQILTQIESKATEDRFYAELDRGKIELRRNLKSILHEVSVLKSVHELGRFAEINELGPSLLGPSRGMSEVALDVLSCQLDLPTKSIEEMVSVGFGNLVTVNEEARVYVPERRDFVDVPVDEITPDFRPPLPSSDHHYHHHETEEGHHATTVAAGADAEASTAVAGAHQTRGRPSVSRRSLARASGSRRYTSDLGGSVGRAEVQEHLEQFQSARESFRSRRQEILRQGHVAREDLSPLRSAGGSGSDGRKLPWPHNLRRGRVQSLDRSAGADERAGRAGLLQYMGGSKGEVAVSRTGDTHQWVESTASRAEDSKWGRGPEGLVVPSPIIEEGAVPRSPKAAAAANAAGVREERASGRLLPNTPSPGDAADAEGRRRTISLGSSLDETPPPSPTSSDNSSTGDFRFKPSDGSRPLRKALSSTGDKRSKMEFLRENWQKRKEILIQSQGFVPSDGASTSGKGKTDSVVSSPGVTTSQAQMATVSGANEGRIAPLSFSSSSSSSSSSSVRQQYATPLPSSATKQPYATPLPSSAMKQQYATPMPSSAMKQQYATPLPSSSSLQQEYAQEQTKTAKPAVKSVAFVPQSPTITFAPDKRLTTAGYMLPGKDNGKVANVADDAKQATLPIAGQRLNSVAAASQSVVKSMKAEEEEGEEEEEEEIVTTETFSVSNDLIQKSVGATSDKTPGCEDEKEGEEEEEEIVTTETFSISSTDLVPDRAETESYVNALHRTTTSTPPAPRVMSSSRIKQTLSLSSATTSTTTTTSSSNSSQVSTLSIGGGSATTRTAAATTAAPPSSSSVYQGRTSVIAGTAATAHLITPSMTTSGKADADGTAPSTSTATTAAAAEASTTSLSVRNPPYPHPPHHHHAHPRPDGARATTTTTITTTTSMKTSTPTGNPSSTASSASATTTTSAAVAAAGAASTTSFSSSSSSSTSTAPSQTTTTASTTIASITSYLGRYSRRQRPKVETIDVASLLANMYKPASASTSASTATSSPSSSSSSSSSSSQITKKVDEEEKENIKNENLSQSETRLSKDRSNFRTTVGTDRGVIKYTFSPSKSVLGDGEESSAPVPNRTQSVVDSTLSPAGNANTAVYKATATNTTSIQSRPVLQSQSHDSTTRTITTTTTTAVSSPATRVTFSHGYPRRDETLTVVTAPTGDVAKTGGGIVDVIHPAPTPLRPLSSSPRDQKVDETFQQAGVSRKRFDPASPRSSLRSSSRRHTVEIGKTIPEGVRLSDMYSNKPAAAGGGSTTALVHRAIIEETHEEPANKDSVTSSPHEPVASRRAADGGPLTSSTSRSPATAGADGIIGGGGGGGGGGALTTLVTGRSEIAFASSPLSPLAVSSSTAAAVQSPHAEVATAPAPVAGSSGPAHNKLRDIARRKKERWRRLTIS